MRMRSSSAFGRSKPPTPRLVLALVLSVAAFFAASLRPVPLSVVTDLNVIATPDGDTPVALEDGEAQCRGAVVRPPRDGRGHGARARDIALVLPELFRPRWTGQVCSEGPLAVASAGEQASARRVRRHAELMVFLL